MISKSLSQAIKDAEKEMPAGGGFAAWEDGDYEVVVVASNRTEQFGTDRVGIQVQRSDDNSRRWFDFSFDDSNPKALAMTGRKLSALGLDGTLETLSDTYPIDDSKSEAENKAALHAQLEGLSSALVGIKFVASVVKKEKQKKPGEFLNWFDVKSLIDGPSTTVSKPAAAGGLSGLVG